MAPCTVQGPIPEMAVSSAMQLVVGQAAQHVRVQPAVRHAPGEVAQGGDLPPGQPGLAELAGVDGQQFGRGREVTAEQGLDPGQGPAGRRHGQLLPGDLEQQRTVQVHRRQLGHPRPRVEVGPVVDEPGQHRVGVAQVGTRLPQPRGAAGIPGHRARSSLASACAVAIPPGAEDGARFWASGPRRSRTPPTTAPLAKMPAIHQNPVS